MYSEIKNDLSFKFYKLYTNLKCKDLKITLIDGTEINGKIVGYFYGDEDRSDPYIYKWHIATNQKKLDIDFMGNEIGRYILQKDLAQIYIFETKTIFSF